MDDRARLELIRKYRLVGDPKTGLIAATFGFFVGFAAVALYGPAAKIFKEAMGLSGFLLGLLVAASQLTGSLLRIPFGAWVDKVGGKKPLLTLLILSIIGMAGISAILLLYYPHGLDFSLYPAILIFGFLAGCGVATFSVGIPQTSYWYPKSRQGWALGTYAGLGNTAPGIFTLIIPYALLYLGLTGAYLAWFIFLLIGTIIYLIIAHDAYYFQLIKQGLPREESISVARELGQELFPSGRLIDALKISARIGRTWALVFLYFTSFGGFLALTTWFPAYWTLYHGLDLRIAGIFTAVFFSLLASLIRVYGGALSDKIGGENTAILSFILVLVGAIVMILTGTILPLSYILGLIGSIIIGLGMGIANAAVFKLVPKYVPEAVGGASGWVGGLGAFGGFVVPPILGAFVDIYRGMGLGDIGFSIGFIVYVLLALTCLGISYILKKRFG